MAQFEIIDEYTYEVCLLPKEKALAFVDYLRSIGINAKAKVGYSGNYIIFVTNELEVTKAKQELIRYATSPYAKEFNKASWDQGKTIKNEKQIINILSKSNVKIYNRKNLKEFCETLNLSNDIIINKALVKVCLDKDIERLIDNYVISKFGINKFKDIMMENEIINRNIQCKNICDFFEIPSNKTKLIVSSGPSLDLLINALFEQGNNEEALEYLLEIKIICLKDMVVKRLCFY